MTNDDLIDIITTNPINRAILERMPKTGAPDAWLVSGSLFQTVWNQKTGRSPTYGIKDYDIFYFDGSDLSFEAEDRIIQKAAAIFADLDAEIEVRNQARVHLWYPQKFNMPYPPLTCSTDGIDRFLAIACMVGIKATSEGSRDVYAPFGLEDLEAMIVRPNAVPNFNADRYKEKTARWRHCWPELDIIMDEPKTMDEAGSAESGR